MSEGQTFLKRTAICDDLSLERDGDEVVLNGWVNRRRDHGGYWHAALLVDPESRQLHQDHDFHGPDWVGIVNYRPGHHR